MARSRMIKPEFFLDEELAEVSATARLLYIGLWGLCDDNYATLPNRPNWIKAQVFPYNSVKVSRVLTELSESGHIVPFKDEKNEEFWYLPNFLKHQKIDHPSQPKYPEYKGESRVSLDESSRALDPKLINISNLNKLKERKGITASPSVLNTAKLREQAHKLGGKQ